MKKILSTLTLAIALAPSAGNTYDFSIGSSAGDVWDVVVHTASVFCHNRHPIANGSPNAVSFGEAAPVKGSTAPGCLITKVVFNTTDGNFYESGGHLYPGGRWTLEDRGNGPFVLCSDSGNNRCGF